MRKVLILGGGFAGVKAAIELQKSKQFDVVLVSDRDYLFSYPVSIWIPVHLKEFDEVKIPLNKIRKKHHFKLVIDKVTGINAVEKKVTCENQVMDYDYLIVAFGADKLQLKGMENTYSICGKPEVTLELREQIDKLVKKGNGKIAIGFGGNPKDKSSARGGPAFEFLFNLHHYLKKKGLINNFELSLFAPMEEPGAKMGKGALKMLNSMIEKQGIKKQFGLKIKEFVKDGIIFEDDSKLESDLTMFISAGTGSAILKNSNLPLSESGFVIINDFNQVKGFPEVFAVGDTAAYQGPDWIAKQGHIAELMGKNAALNIIEIENGGEDFKGYQEHLSILCVMDTGNGAAFVFRNDKKAFTIPMSIFGHWLKIAWGVYAKRSKI